MLRICEKRFLKLVAGGILLVLVIGLLLSSGCKSEKRTGTAPLTNLVAELEGLYRGYLTNDYADAKRNMEQAVQLLHRPNQRKYAERGLWLNYGRLYCLEARFGDSNVAHVYYEKARYWYLVNLETDEKLPSEISSKLQHFTQEQCKHYILEWDAAQTVGKGAKYLQNPKP